jgi:hypothetical protein
MFEACEFHYYIGVLDWVVMVVDFVTTKKMESFYDAISNDDGK